MWIAASVSTAVRPGDSAEKQMRLLSHVPLFLLLAAPVAAGTLRQDAESFAGAPVGVDARLAQQTCPGGHLLAWSGSATDAVVARCGEGGPALILPLLRRASRDSAPALHRGDRVTVVRKGDGFRVRMEAVADGIARDGRIRLRNARSGRTIMANMDTDGRNDLVGLDTGR
jgi:hypothetical protein